MPVSEPQPQTQPGAKPAPRRGGAAGVVEDGVLAGAVGAAVVAVWFLILDVARGQPFLTPSLLGSVLFLGASVEEAAELNVVMVFAYTGVHGLIFLAAGAVIAWIVGQFEQNPQFGLVLLLLFFLFQAVLFGLEVTIVPNLVGALGAVSVALANLFSAAAMFWFLLLRRPEALARLRESWEE
jgi:hypothetical protein